METLVGTSSNQVAVFEAASDEIPLVALMGMLLLLCCIERSGDRIWGNVVKYEWYLLFAIPVPPAPYAVQKRCPAAYQCALSRPHAKTWPQQVRSGSSCPKAFLFLEI